MTQKKERTVDKSIAKKRKIASQLKKGREDAKFSQLEAAKKLYLDPSIISKLESGKLALSFERAAEFSKLYQKTLYFFLGDLD